MDSINRIRFSGIASGLDTENIVKNLMNIEQMKVDRQIQKKTLLEWKRDEYRNINNRLRTLREQNVFNLKLQGTFLAKKVASSDESALSATASFNTLEGSYTVTVNKLAKAASFTATPADLGENGLVPVETEASFTINGGEGREDVTITVGHSDTLASVVAKINANSSKSGVRAMYDENLNKLFLTSTSTGEKAAINITGGDEDLLSNLGLTTGNLGTGQNAEIIFNGETLTFASNQFSLFDIDMTLKKAGETVDITVNKDIDSVIEQIKSFVEQYNTIMEDIGTKLSEKRYRDYPPLTDAQKEEMEEKEIEKWEEKARSGLLRADSLLSSIASSLRMTLGGVVETGSKYKTLSSIGITTSSNWNDKGKLYLDEEELRKALTEDLDGVMKIFSNNSEDPKALGIARKLDDMLLGHMESVASTAGRNIIGADESYLGREIMRMDKGIKEMQDRFIQLEESYWRKFTAMEKALQRMQSQSDWLSNQLQGLG